MHDELEEDRGRAEDLARSHTAEARPQSRHELHDGEESLKEDES